VGGGFCVPPDDVPAIAAAVRRLAASPEERLVMGAKSRKYVEDFYSRDRVLDSFEDMLRRFART
jgi:glycosyltransferase involved in cell wall biosynthesis